jgi:serine protease Do
MNSEIRMMKTHQCIPFGIWSLVLFWCLELGIWSFSSQLASGQDKPNLPANRYLHGEQTLQAFTPVSKATRDSIVKFNVDGETVVLGTVIDTNGLVLTKASEIKPGKLTCWLATEQEVAATVLATDEEQDVALVSVQARNLKPIQWSTNQVAIGQWAVTPGIAATPQAVGIISALPRRIRPPRALIGVQFFMSSVAPKIQSLYPGMGAEKAGLKPDDIILAVDGEALTNRAQMVEMLRDYRDGHTLKLRVERSGSPFEADVQMKVPLPDDLAYDGGPRNAVLNGEVSRRAEGFDQAIEHASVLPPWLCGGPLVNLEGKAIGVNIARASRVSTYALPSNFVQDIVKKLLSKSKAQV